MRKKQTISIVLVRNQGEIEPGLRMYRDIPGERENLIGNPHSSAFVLPFNLLALPIIVLLRTERQKSRSELRDLRHRLRARQDRDPGPESPPDLREIAPDSR